MMVKKTNETVGIDVGSEHVKVICLKNNTSRYHLVAHAFFKRDNRRGLRELFRHPILRRGEVRVSIDDPNMKIRKVDLPRVPEEELREIVPWSLKDVIQGGPDQIDGYLFRYLPLSSLPSEKTMPYLVFALPRQRVQEQLAYLKELGLADPRMVEPQIHALAYNVLYNYDLEPNDRHALIDFGKTFTLFATVCSEGLLFCRPMIGMAGETLTQQIMRDLGIDQQRAEQYKVETAKEKIPEDKNQTLQNTIAHYLSKLLVEIQRSMDTYLMLFPNQPITHLFLTGGGSQLFGLASHVQQTLNVPTAMLEPFNKIDTASFYEDEIAEKRHCYGVAAGLALD